MSLLEFSHEFECLCMDQVNLRFKTVDELRQIIYDHRAEKEQLLHELQIAKRQARATSASSKLSAVLKKVSSCVSVDAAGLMLQEKRKGERVMLWWHCTLNQTT